MFKIIFLAVAFCAPVFLSNFFVHGAEDMEPHARPLHDYVALEDDSFGFEVIDERKMMGGTVYIIDLVSQNWRGFDWQHWMTVYVPRDSQYEDGAVLIVEGGNNDPDPPSTDMDTMAEAFISSQFKMPLVILQQVPNQPMFDGLREDALIAMTFERFLQDGEEDWPLLLPMTKSAVRAMDAAESFLKDHYGMDIRNFVVGGGSKRGWTSYLTAAVDDRVAGVVPVVIDVLNITEHMEVQIKSYGQYSEMIGDYSERNLIARMKAGEGRQLVEMVDPYSYRELLTMPKLIMLGTNDPYWVVDAAGLYFPGLPEPKYLHYGIGEGHGISLESIPTLITFFHSVFDEDIEMPHISWESVNGELVIEWSSRNAEASLVSARSPSRDFRDAEWDVQPLSASGNSVNVEPEKPEDGYMAYFVQVSFPAHTREGLSLPVPLRLATPVEVIPHTFPFKSDGTPRDN